MTSIFPVYKYSMNRESTSQLVRSHPFKCTTCHLTVTPSNFSSNLSNRYGHRALSMIRCTAKDRNFVFGCCSPFSFVFQICIMQSACSELPSVSALESEIECVPSLVRLFWFMAVKFCCQLCRYGSTLAAERLHSRKMERKEGVSAT